MALIYRLISKTPNYVKRFGLIHGFRLLFQVERSLSKKSGRIKKYLVPGVPHPIYLRENIGDHAIFWQCIVSAQYDYGSFRQNERLMSTYHSMVEQGKKPLIIDCGGNIGLATVWLATNLPDAKVVVVEPDENNLKILEMNTRGYQERVTVLRGGVWSQKGRLKIINPDAGPASFQVTVADEEKEDSLRAYTIDEICLLAGVDAPFIVKIDIEGAQSNLFRANTDWVGNTHLIVLELEDWKFEWQGTSRPFFSCMSRYPFDYLIGGENMVCFRDFAEKEFT